MEVEFVGSEVEIDWGLLQNRFPSIAFALSYSSCEKMECFLSVQGFLNGKTQKGFLYNDDVEKELFEWKSSLSLEAVDVLYVYGVGLGHYYKALKSWLFEKKERRVLFFEEDLSVLDALFHQEIGSEMLADLQVHFYYKPEGSSWDDLLEECVQVWVSDRIEWTSLLSYRVGREKKLQSLRLKLLRRSTSVHAQVGEALHYHLLMQNILKNLREIPRSFYANQLQGKFKNVPAIICGAGRSLSDEAFKLKDLEQKAIVIAGGSAITALGFYKVNPHIAIALDPNEEEYFRLKTSSSFETPFIYSSRIHKDVLSSTNVQMGYLCSNTGGVLEQWVHERLGIGSEESFGDKLGEEALSVTTLAVAFAKELGCNPILFCGVDLSYGDMQRYASGVLASSQVFLDELEQVTKSRDRFVRRKNGEGRFVHTLVKWVMEASCIGDYAKKHPETQFFNVSEKGLPILGVPTLSLEEFSSLYCKENYNLRGRLQAEIAEASFQNISEQSLKEEFQSLQMSFEECIPLFQQMIEEIEKKTEVFKDTAIPLESWKMSLIEMDLKEKPAYRACLILSFIVYQRILDWWRPCLHSLETEEGRLNFLEKKKHLWQEGEKIAKECLSLLKSF